MFFDVHAVPQAEFDAWVTQARDRGESLDRKSYEQLAKQSMRVVPFTYRDADPALFNQIVTQDIPPAPGPQSGFPSTDVSNRTEQ